MAAEPAEEWIELVQSESAVLEHQRLPGNARAQAKRRGAIRNVPHLFVYHRDDSPAFHMDGIRTGFERQLNLLIDAFRIDRSMVELEVLLENARTPDGEPVTRDDLPKERIVLVLYGRADCAACDELVAELEAWLDDRPELDTVQVWIRMP
ncbi:hypothetical protein HFP89_15405 [Wenzhouxiangella sp. XN79A]|uniref:hypothetical protein n=1 Tax=Wenzhouxiangella sp. XN79A TaxID=2724193 RepID=UPI00144A5504|nr:hypothetical protein [Wenzhouxiangella sp. XN79A]NKI36557.1 hypothetical protein [Wenzhouxiangella sp. XN79A]